MLHIWPFSQCGILGNWLVPIVSITRGQSSWITRLVQSFQLTFSTIGLAENKRGPSAELSTDLTYKCRTMHNVIIYSGENCSIPQRVYITDDWRHWSLYVPHSGYERILTMEAITHDWTDTLFLCFCQGGFVWPVSVQQPRKKSPY